MAQKIRRVVTEQISGRGKIISDTTAPDALRMPGGAVVELWRDDRDSVSTEFQPWALCPPPGGSVLRIAEFAPSGPVQDPMMHLTETIDYGIVLDGEVVLVMDDGETTLYPGDIVVQRAAHHGWLNRSATVSRMLFVLIDRPVA